MARSMRGYLCAVLALVAVTAAAAQDCPDLFSNTAADSESLVRDCTGSGSCESCQCSLVKALTASLVQSGKILESEAWMPSSFTTIADTLTACKRQFQVQLLQNTETPLSQLARLQYCSSDIIAVSACMSQPAAAASTAAAAPAAAATSMTDEVLAEACALAVSGSGNATDCPSPAAAQVVAGVPMSGGGVMVFAPASDASILRISASNTRGSTTWQAFCWCEATWDPVCDAMTRKQYPNTCSAQCQSVSNIVPCGSLEPLVNQTMAGNTAAFVIDQALISASAGPTPDEAPEDSQNFYYYYEEHVDDTQDALEIATTLTEAFLAARLGGEAAAVDAVASQVPSALRAGMTASANVTGADGPEDADASAVGAFRNITITRQRRGAGRDSRNMSVPTNTGMMPTNPAWMLTSAPGYTAGVYKRDADRTSRILASLMAAAQGANNRTEAPSNRQTLNVTNMVAAAAGAMEAVADSNTPAGGLLRSAQSAMTNVTTFVNETMSNATGNSTNAMLRAFSGLAQNPSTTTPSVGLGNILQQLRNLVQGSAARPAAVGAFQGGGLLRSATNTTMDMDMAIVMNGTMNGTMNSTSAGNSTGGLPAARAAAARKQPKRRLLFF